MNLSPTWINSQKTSCLRGHPFDEENTCYRYGKRHCRECQRQHNRNYAAKQKNLPVALRYKRRRSTNQIDQARELSRELLLQVFQYDAETGAVTWRQRPREHFSQNGPFRTWNLRFSGVDAGRLGKDGYYQIQLFGKRYQSHRLIWLMTTGMWPDQIDHINGDRQDNRLVNLRDVSAAENAKNQSLSSRNTYGCLGVSWNARDQRWIASITSDHKVIALGSFLTKEDAIAARKAAEPIYGFHENHGRAPIAKRNHIKFNEASNA